MQKLSKPTDQLEWFLTKKEESAQFKEYDRHESVAEVSGRQCAEDMLLKLSLERKRIEKKIEENRNEKKLICTQ